MDRDPRYMLRRLHRAGDSAQVTIPAAMRRALGLNVGDQVYIYLVGRVLCMKRFDDGGFTPEVINIPGGHNER